MGFSRQEYCSWLLFPPPGDLPSLAIEPTSTVVPTVQADSVSLSHRRSPHLILPGGNSCFCPEFILAKANIYNHDVHQLVIFICFSFYWNKTIILCHLFVYRMQIPLSGNRFRSNFFFSQIPSLRPIVIKMLNIIYIILYFLIHTIIHWKYIMHIFFPNTFFPSVTTIHSITLVF